MVCNDPRVIELMDRFVPVVDDPSNYPRSASNRLQYRLVEQILGQTVYRQIVGAQGLYIVSPNGQLLAGTTEHSNPSRVLSEMRRGLDIYSRQSKAQRLLAKEPVAATDRVDVVRVDATPPEGGLILRMVTRGLPDSGIDRQDTRHSSFYKLDRVWLTRDQARSFLPTTLKEGEKLTVRGGGLNIVARLHLGVYVQPNPAWMPEDVKQLELTSEITSVRGDLVEARFTGEARYEANSNFNDRKYAPRILGKAVWNKRENRFTTFELLAVGTHTLGTRGEDVRSRGPKACPLGVFFTLNGTNANDNVTPHYWPQYDWAARTR